MICHFKNLPEQLIFKTFVLKLYYYPIPIAFISYPKMPTMTTGYDIQFYVKNL